MDEMTEKEKNNLVYKIALDIAEAAGQRTEDMELILTAYAHALAHAGVVTEKNKKHFISYVVHVIDSVYKAEGEDHE